MLARTADSLYWMNRYMERIDLILRTLKNGVTAGYDINTKQIFNWESILGVFSSLSDDEIKATAKGQNECIRLLMVGDRNNSVNELITRARENARGAQDHLTKEVWEAINQKYHSVKNINIEKVIGYGEPLNFLINQINESTIYSGVFESTMHRGQGWNFMNLGRFTERFHQTLNLVDVKFRDFNIHDSDTSHILFWKNLLLNLSGYELYLKTYRGAHHMENVIDMMFLNKEFTRSIIYTMQKIKFYITKILADNENPGNKEIENTVGMLHAKIAFTDVASIREKTISKFINELRLDLFKMTQLIGQSFFSYY